MGNLISISFNDDAEKYYSLITVNGVATSHYIEKSNVAGPKEAMLIMVADALGFEPANVLNFDMLGVPDLNKGGK